ncbi:MAG: hypothetical protein WCK10_01745, partial [Candidatus Staskawiczbacteria bacterium]
IIEKGCKERICQKYREKEKIGSTYGTIDWAKQDESWYNFFQHVGLLGLDKGEGCDFLEI